MLGAIKKESDRQPNKSKQQQADWVDDRRGLVGKEGFSREVTLTLCSKG